MDLLTAAEVVSDFQDGDLMPLFVGERLGDDPDGAKVVVSRHAAARLEEVAAELNDRPRKTLGWEPQPSASLNSCHQPTNHQWCDDRSNPPIFMLNGLWLRLPAPLDVTPSQ